MICFDFQLSQASEMARQPFVFSWTRLIWYNVTTLAGFGLLQTATATCIVSVVGVIMLTVARTGLDDDRGWYRRLWNKAALVGLGSGLFFAIASLCLRQASLSFGIDNSLFTAGLTLVTMVVLQTGIMLTWVAARTPAQLRVIGREWRLCSFVGVTSALGSVGWFVAMTLERASYVKALGQIEFLFALAISATFFRERSSRLELFGMCLIASGILALIAFG